MSIRLLAIVSAAALAAGCQRAAPRPTSGGTAAVARSIFSDSAAHRASCEPPKAGEDWRLVCTPRDQGIRRIPVQPSSD